MEISAGHALTIHSHPAIQSQGPGRVAGGEESLQDAQSPDLSKNPDTAATGSVTESEAGRESATGSESENSAAGNGSQLNEAELKQVEQLARRDLEVRQHEQAHAAVGGSYAGAPEYEYTRGPDGRMYAAGGEVSIDTSPVPGDPAATIEKMQVVIAAATAPVEPSSQDLRVAAAAQAMLAEAQAELLQTEAEGAEEADAEAEESGEADGSAADGGSARGAERSADGLSSADAEESTQQVSGQSENREQVRQLEQKLVDSGVFSQLFPSGSLISQIT
ncbi:putative metalloprotease CJM1_0395 family protein [Marinobacterium jannaschii]|uniref:putative metalloprotease CJM1_0395 family protein n=1 Tax=Marinobacterium jannaschii TaxID=64970 RepID=UPI000688ABF0|nr:putative metalloprotease CJM1_0395 family protein [Marinobacterium jannaschii]